MTAPEIDPFAGGDKTPALSFKDEPVGTVKAITVTEPAKLLQSTNFDTQEPDFWPGKNGQPGNPKMAAVINGTTDDGEQRSVWAVKPSALFHAIKDAQMKLGRSLKPGDKLAIKYTGDKPNEKNPRLNPAKQYAAKIDPAPEVPADAFGDEPPF